MKVAQKLKILKTNTTSCSIGSKLKQIKTSLGKQGRLGEDREVITFRTKYEESNKKKND